MDENCYVALAGIDLSAAFDVDDVELLIKRLMLTLNIFETVVRTYHKPKTFL